MTGVQTCALPISMQTNPHYENLFDEIDRFFRERIEKANAFGIKKLILDTGIGFGKSLEHNLSLIKHQKHFARLGYPLLIGASRKSMIDKIISTNVEDRLPGTLAIHLKALNEGASIVRVHDVKEHYQAIKVNEAINSIGLDIC